MRSARCRLALSVLALVVLQLTSCGGHPSKPSPQPSQFTGVLGIVVISDPGGPMNPPTHAMPSGFSTPSWWGPGWLRLARASVRLQALSGKHAGHVVVTIKSDAEGFFRVALAPGKYVVWPMGLEELNVPVATRTKWLASMQVPFAVQAGHCTRVVVRSL